MHNGVWKNVSIPSDACLLLFGWVTQVRSNDRIPAVLHRVRDRQEETAAEEVPRRVSAVLFVGPEPDTDLTPVLKDEGEKPKVCVQKYIFFSFFLLIPPLSIARSCQRR